MNHLARSLVRSDGDHAQDLCERLYQWMVIRAFEHQKANRTIDRGDQKHRVGHGDMVRGQQGSAARRHVLPPLDVQAIQRVRGNPQQQSQQRIRKQVQHISCRRQRAQRRPEENLSRVLVDRKSTRLNSITPIARMPSSACTATTRIHTLSLHDALPISGPARLRRAQARSPAPRRPGDTACAWQSTAAIAAANPEAGTAHKLSPPACPAPTRRKSLAGFGRSEEHTSELHHANSSYAVFCLHGHHPYPHSFPTRRSSDLGASKAPPRAGTFSRPSTSRRYSVCVAIHSSNRSSESGSRYST